MDDKKQNGILKEEEQEKQYITSDDIKDIVWEHSEYHWNFGYNEFQFSCMINGEKEILEMLQQRHDVGYGFTIHSRNNDIWDRCMATEIYKLEDRLQEAIQYGEYHERIQKLKTKEECEDMQFDFMENENVYFQRSLNKLWTELENKENELARESKVSIKDKLRQFKADIKEKSASITRKRTDISRQWLMLI